MVGRLPITMMPRHSGIVAIAVGACVQVLDAGGTATRNRPRPPPLQEPASEIELDQLRYMLRATQHELNSDIRRLVVLNEALERARAQGAAEASAFAEAETAWRETETRLHSRTLLVEAFVRPAHRRGDPRPMPRLSLTSQPATSGTPNKSSRHCASRSPRSRTAARIAASP